MKLDELRSELSAVDRQLVELIAERQRLVGEIGRSKQSTGTGTRDYAREKDVLEMGRSQAEELGLDPDLAENVLRELIASSLESQERDRVISEGKGDGRSVLVIGGAGKMGAVEGGGGPERPDSGFKGGSVNIVKQSRAGRTPASVGCNSAPGRLTGGRHGRSGTGS